MKRLNNKVEISQAGVDAIFRLSDKELKVLRLYSDRVGNYSREQRLKANFGMCHNFSMHAFFDYETTRSKSGRFNSLFNYHKGDYTWRVITDEEKDK